MSLAEGDEKKTARSPRGRRRAEDSDALDEDAGGDPRRAGPDGGFLPELLRRGLTLGWLEFMVGQSEKTRTELLERLSREFGKVLTAIDPVEILRRLLDGQTIEVSAKIKLANGGRTRRPGPAEDAGTQEEEG
jgi:hypothetical protein